MEMDGNRGLCWLPGLEWWSPALGPGGASAATDQEQSPYRVHSRWPLHGFCHHLQKVLYALS